MLVWTVVLLVNLAALVSMTAGGGAWWQFVVAGGLVLMSVTWLTFSAQQLRNRS
jgi:hypothetical protein